MWHYTREIYRIPMKKIKIGILGCGAVAHRWYLKGLADKNDLYTLESVCDIDAARAKFAADQYKIAGYFSKPEDFLKSGLDLIVVLTRHNDH